MRGTVASGVAVLGLAAGAQAQMPGTPVGTPLVQPVGSRLPQAVPSVGAKVGTGPGGIPGGLDPLGPKPDGKAIELTNVVAPYPGQPKPTPNFWEKLEARWFALFESDRPAVKPSNWTPGLGRRNRDRKEAREEEARRR